jgi:hypothetical protein
VAGIEVWSRPSRFGINGRAKAGWESTKRGARHQADSLCGVYRVDWRHPGGIAGPRRLFVVWCDCTSPKTSVGRVEFPRRHLLICSQARSTYCSEWAWVELELLAELRASDPAIGLPF